MKFFLGLSIMAALSFTVCGCMSAREEQNPQPRICVPCKEWEDEAKKADKQTLKGKTPEKKNNTDKKGKAIGKKENTFKKISIGF